MPKALFRLLAAICLAVGLYAWLAYAAWPVGTVLHPDIRASFARQSEVVLHVHVFAAALALLIGPMQFSRGLRARWPQLHRGLGLTYLGAGVLIGGTTGAMLALGAFGGAWSRAGFLLLSLAWLFTGAMAGLKVLRGDIDGHRRWMMRNFALAVAAVSLRLWLPAMALAGVEMAVAYPLVAWLCWVPQLLAVECHLAAAARGRTVPRWAAGLVVLVTGCSAIQPARVSLPAELAGRVESIELRGIGAGARGQTTLLGQVLWFERSASRTSFFDDLARTDRSALQWRWGADGGQRADCRGRRRTHAAGVLELVSRPLEVVCQFEPGGGSLTLVETATATRTLKRERRGELRIGDSRWTVRTLHRPQGAVLDTAEPLAYAIEAEGRAVAMVELQGTRPILHLPAADDPRRQRLLPALLSLALMWDESAS